MSARLVWKIMLGFYIAVFFAFLFGPLVIMSVTAFNISSYPQVWPFEGFNWPQGAAYAFILLIACMAFVLIVMRLFKVSLSEITR